MRYRGLEVVEPPRPHGQQHWFETLATGSEAVLHPGRHLGECLPGQNAESFEMAEATGQGSRADPTEAGKQGAESQSPIDSEGTREMSTITDLNVANRIYKAFDSGDVSVLDEILHPDLIDHNPVPGAASAIQGVRLLVTQSRTASRTRAMTSSIKPPRPTAASSHDGA
jgi:hypothetical protein